jgi:hypothetical protein
MPRIAAAALLIAMIMTSWVSQAEPKRGERVSITGCTYQGTSARCLMMRGKDGSRYNISAVSPRPRQSNRMIRVRGAVSDKLSDCGEGIVLERIRWTRTRQHCPN